MSGVIGVFLFNGAGLGGNANGLILDAEDLRLENDSLRPTVPGTVNREGDSFSSSIVALSRDEPRKGSSSS